VSDVSETEKGSGVFSPDGNVRKRLPTPFLAIAVALAALVGCNDQPGTQTATSETKAEATNETDWFVDRAAESGLDFVHFNGMSGKFYMAEVLAPGVGLLDYDNDGDLDVYLVQGQMLGTGTPTFPPKGSQPPTDRLYRNDLQVRPDGTRTLRFTDVTKETGITAQGYGMGVAAGDFNNDGWVDIYLTKFGPNQMFRNNGNGTFTDVSKESGTNDDSWSVSASFVDFDRDGWLDLYVGKYLRYSLGTHTDCFSSSGALDYCTPKSYQALPGRLYHNQRNGTFADVTARSRVASEFGPALGVTTADFDGDGWIDIYVANDGKENQLWINQRNGTFRNDALLAGAALPVDGKAEGSMGVDAGDFDNDGDEDLFMTELTFEGSNLYVNDGSGSFEDRSAHSELGPRSIAFTGFGTSWFDFDNDGWLDLLTVNGDVQTIQALAQAKDPFPLHQRKQLFRNLGNGRFEDVGDRAGGVFKLSEVGRGAAFGDIDNDGDLDVLVGNNNGPTRLLINTIGSRKHWVGLRVVGGSKDPPLQKLSGTLKPNGRGGSLDPPAPLNSRDMLGARVGIVLKDGSTRWRRVRSDGSYGSANDPRVLIGLGDVTDAPRVRVRWPDGRTQEWPQVQIDRWTTITDGTSP
jgi:hypothetical protein